MTMIVAVTVGGGVRTMAMKVFTSPHFLPQINSYNKSDGLLYNTDKYLY
jgi:hypothetical protein